MQVVIFDDESNGHNHNPQATFVWNDISTKADFDKYEGPVDYVIHLAAASKPPPSRVLSSVLTRPVQSR